MSTLDRMPAPSEFSVLLTSSDPKLRALALERLSKALEATGGNRSYAATRLGLSYRSLRDLLAADPELDASIRDRYAEADRERAVERAREVSAAGVAARTGRRRPAKKNRQRAP